MESLLKKTIALGLFFPILTSALTCTNHFSGLYISGGLGATSVHFSSDWGPPQPGFTINVESVGGSNLSFLGAC